VRVPSFAYQALQRECHAAHHGTAAAANEIHEVSGAAEPYINDPADAASLDRVFGIAKPEVLVSNAGTDRGINRT